MELIRFENYTFCYPNEKKPALDCIDFTVSQGDFITVCGRSGSGKSTLLKCMKPELSPHGEKNGRILFSGEQITDINVVDSTKIGFVMQNPDNQIVTDTVWHELAFGLENMGMDPGEMRIRVAEIATFFGIEKLFHKNTAELSGGQKQILNLASVMVMEPELLILDEPTSQLDPVMAGEFFSALKRINEELGTAVVLCEHRTEDIFPLVKRVIVMEDGRIVADTAPAECARILKNTGSDMFLAMPSVMRIYELLDAGGKCPVGIADARAWLDGFMDTNACAVAFLNRGSSRTFSETALSVRDIYYKYDKKNEYVLSGLSFEVKKGEVFGILGGNGSGKSTLLWLLSGSLKTKSGKVRVSGKVAMLPQNPETLFIKETALEDLLEVADNDSVEKVMEMCKIAHLKDRHPYDLSGGEQQKLALCKVLLKEPDVIFLDEPTKGLDAHFKSEFEKIIENLTEKGVTVVMVSHDVEFCAKACDRCALMFDGKLISCDETRTFFSGKKFYTTQTARLFKGYAQNVILPDEAVEIFKMQEGTK